MMRKAVLAVALALGAVAAPAAPASAAPAHVQGGATTAAIDRRCGNWAQVIPNVWAIICLDRSGALFQPYGEMRNYSASPVTMDQFLSLNGVVRTVCGFSPATAPPGAQLTCTNNSWWTAGSPRTATGDFWVNGAHLTLTSPSFP